MLVGGDSGSDARGDRAGRRGRVAGQPAERALAGEADDDRPAEREQDVEAADELEVVLDRLPEADARVEADPLLRDPGVDREGKALLEERRDLGCDVVVARVGLHRARLALHVHQAQVGAGLGDDPGELGIAAQRGDVVHELGAERERAPCDLGLRRVDRDGLPLELLEHRQDAAQLLVERDAVRAGPGRLAADVDDRGALGEHPPG